MYFNRVFIYFFLKINYRYPDLDSFVADVDLVFENCEKFNEDDSDIGRAGHSMRNFFDKRRAELLHY